MSLFVGENMNDLKIVMLDTSTLGGDLEFLLLEKFGSVSMFEKTEDSQVRERISDADIVIVNKIKLNEINLSGARRLKLICVTATGFDNIDIGYCKKRGIAVCNVKGYSTDSVAQVTLAMALSLVNNLAVFDKYVKSGEYTNSGIPNKVTPSFSEMKNMTWGVVGLGAIGKRVAELAEAFGCRILVYKRNPDERYNCVSIDELCEESDIISVHIPLTDKTRELINAERIAKMKNTAIFINVARGAVVDENALVCAVRNNGIGGLGVDVYSSEPLISNSPYLSIKDYDNVILTPHMAWGAYEARMRCIEEIAKNIDAFINGTERNRVDK